MQWLDRFSARRRDGGARRRAALRPHLGVEDLEGRRLLASGITAVSNVVASPQILSGLSNGPEITRGPDGNLWVAWGTASGTGTIARVAPDGTVATYSVPGYVIINSITAGPDGNLWFTATGNPSGLIGMITPQGGITEYALSSAGNGQPNAIVSGPDGNLWFTDAANNSIGQITPSGSISYFPLPNTTDTPSGIALGPDGNLWFTEPLARQIGRITPTGTITQFGVPNNGTFYPVMITKGTDGLWFVQQSLGSKTLGDISFGHITTSGVVTQFPRRFPRPIAKTQLNNQVFTTGPDGSLWVAAGPTILKVSPTGAVSSYQLASYLGGKNHATTSITTGSDGNLYAIDASTGRVEQIALNSLVAVPAHRARPARR